jgi:hypothetical protein
MQIEISRQIEGKQLAEVLAFISARFLIYSDTCVLLISFLSVEIFAE